MATSEKEVHTVYLEIPCWAQFFRFVAAIHASYSFSSAGKRKKCFPDLPCSFLQPTAQPYHSMLETVSFKLADKKYLEIFLLVRIYMVWMNIFSMKRFIRVVVWCRSDITIIIIRRLAWTCKHTVASFHNLKAQNQMWFYGLKIKHYRAYILTGTCSDWTTEHLVCQVSGANKLISGIVTCSEI